MHLFSRSSPLSPPFSAAYNRITTPSQYSIRRYPLALSLWHRTIPVNLDLPLSIGHYPTCVPGVCTKVLRYCDQETLLLLLVLVYLHLSFLLLLCCPVQHLVQALKRLIVKNISKTKWIHICTCLLKKKNSQQPLITRLVAVACICGVVDLDTSPARVGIASPIHPGNPSDGRTSCRLGRVIAFKDLPYVIRLLGVGSVDRPSFRALFECSVGYNCFGMVLYAIDPAIADTIAELLLLAPEDGPWEVRLRVRSWFHIESLAQYVLERVW